jgi:hypothetical protein
MAVVVAVQDVRTPATPVVALSASAVRHADGRPSTGRADTRCPGDRCPGVRCPGVRCPRDWRPDDRGDPGVRTARRPVSAAAAAALSAPRWIPGVGAAGPATVVAGTSVGGSLAAAWQAHRLRRRAGRLAEPGSWSSARGRSDGWGAGKGRCSHVAPGVCILGRSPA